MLGETELEDWDEKNKPLVFYNYPSIQCGSIIHLIVLTEGICVKRERKKATIRPAERNLTFNLKYDECVCHPDYVNIPDPKMLTLKQLNSRLKPHQSGNNTSAQHTVEITDAPVSTVPWITDGCTLCCVCNGKNDSFSLPNFE